jgi:hypothetical protein
VITTPAQGSNMIHKDCGSYRSITIHILVNANALGFLAEITIEPAITHRIPGKHVHSGLTPLRPIIPVSVGSALERLDPTGFRSVASRLLRHDFTSTVGKWLRIDYRAQRGQSEASPSWKCD